MNHPRKERAEQLRLLGEGQYGYFTAAQAKQLGYGSYDQAYHVEAGHWTRVDVGLYRLPGQADTRAAVFTRWAFWSRNRAGQPQAVVSHASALAHYDPTEPFGLPIHLTVPPRFQKRCPPEVVLHRALLAAEEIETAGLYLVTTRARTWRDTRQTLEEAMPAERAVAHLALPDLTWTDAGKGGPGGLAGASAANKTLSLHTDPMVQEEKFMTETAPVSDASVTIADQGSLPAGRFFGRAYRFPLLRSRHAEEPVRRRAQAGFTLVELLVVTAIISVLAAMLLPALERALASARGISCANNLKQIGIGLTLYADMCGGWTPNLDAPIWTVKASGLPAGSPPSWIGYVVENYDKLDCPSYKLMFFKQGNYGLSFDACAFNYFGKPHRKLDGFKYPSQVLFCCDVFYEGTNDLNAEGYMTGSSYCLDSTAGHSNRHFRHLGALNVIYLDTHYASRRTDILTNDPAWNK